ncbi:MAG: ADP-ribosylation factor-like protein [Candidatus Jordarchaeum sp.]|uniref:ADP-ribosylation factor-like protein n=1 Tax=Candidatus Jordarchaeum sp. TaxID=2823881 RepID=UPI00404AD3DC
MCTTEHAKVSFIGLPAVGKTSIVTLLTDEKVVENYQQTIGLNLGFLSVGDYEVSLFDIAGQGRFHFLWRGLTRGSKVIFIVTDSTPENLAETKQIIEKYANIPGTTFWVIANKQDLPGALSPKQVEDHLGLKTYGMVAIDPKRKPVMCQILREAIEEYVLKKKSN